MWEGRIREMEKKEIFKWNKTYFTSARPHITVVSLTLETFPLFTAAFYHDTLEYFRNQRLKGQRGKNNVSSNTDLNMQKDNIE